MRFFKKPKADVITAEERLLLKKCISEGDVVFDIGAHHGAWSNAVMSIAPVELHAFEANEDAAERYEMQVEGFTCLNRCAVSYESGITSFFAYRNDERLSSIHRRKSVEVALLPDGYEERSLRCMSLDDYWYNSGRQIGFLKIDVEGAEYDALQGASRLLMKGRIDYIQFEYGGTFKDAGTTLRSVWAFLRRMGYRVFLMSGRKFFELENFSESDENYTYSNFVAVHERLADSFLEKNVDIRPLLNDLKKYGISVDGVLHVGAHNGQELPGYFKLGAKSVVLIEANPKLFSNLVEKFRKDPRVSVVHAAAAEKDSTIELNIASMDQSSSILPLDRHAKLYPTIKYIDKVTVPARSIDSLLGDEINNFDRSNILVMDIQGAELLALKGAERFLEGVQAIQTEVNFTSVYAGCGLIGEMDSLLELRGFVRVATHTPYSREWGDALYVRKPFVSMSCIGKMGRFGNQFFQYMYGSVYAEQHQLEFFCPEWDGAELFAGVHARPFPGTPLKKVVQAGYSYGNCSILNAPSVFVNSELEGFFQYHTRVYRAKRTQLLETFRLKGQAASLCEQIKAAFSADAGPVVAIHLRRTDYGTGIYFIAPNEWYLKVLNSLRQEIGHFRLYIATDDPGCIGSDFDEFERIDLSGLHGNQPEFLVDFLALTIADYVAISNSSFSFAATMLNQGARRFWRPSLADKELIEYLPWDAEPLLREEVAERHGEDFMSERAKNRTKFRFRKWLRSLFGF